jgi:hypothetical protein
MPNFKPHFAMLATGISLACASPASAQDASSQPAPKLAEAVAASPDGGSVATVDLRDAQPNEPLPLAARDASLPLLLGDEELAEARGMATIVINQQELDAVVSGNSLGDYVAGSILLSDNALSNFTGVGNFLFNTGAQNNLQAGMALTITIEE